MKEKVERKDNARFVNTLLDEFWEEGSSKFVRCEDRYGDGGLIVGYHKDDEFVSWNWVVRDKDNACVGVQECNIVETFENKPEVVQNNYFVWELPVNTEGILLQVERKLYNFRRSSQY